MKNIIPSFLKSGDKIGIIATARKISQEEVLPAVKMLESWGLEVILGKNLFAENCQFAGTDAQRAQDLQSMLDNPEIKAILCARGGYGTVRIIDQINFDNFKKNPKWLVGYSDVTVLHAHITQNTGVQTLHATMPINFPKDGSENGAVRALKKQLFGDKNLIVTHPHKLNRQGECKGELMGGNLSILYSLLGSNSDIDTSEKILFIEDLDEYLYHIDRMMMALKRAGKLNKLAGLIVGGMSDMNDNTVPFGETAEEVIARIVSEYNYPVCFGFLAGHIEHNLAIRMGAETELQIFDNRVTFLQS